MPDNYVPLFQHQDWTDNVDLVSAEDPVKGFNKRFKDLQHEFTEISRIIGQINGSLSPPTTTLTFAPDLSPNGSTVPWIMTTGIANKEPGKDRAEGWLSLQLPQNSHIESMTVIGNKSGSVNSFMVHLKRQALDGRETTLHALNLANQPDTFHITETIPTIDNLVKNEANKYFVLIKIACDPAARASIVAVQFVCKQA